MLKVGRSIRLKAFQTEAALSIRFTSDNKPKGGIPVSLRIAVYSFS